MSASSENAAEADSNSNTLVNRASSGGVVGTCNATRKRRGRCAAQLLCRPPPNYCLQEATGPNDNPKDRSCSACVHRGFTLSVSQVREVHFDDKPKEVSEKTCRTFGFTQTFDENKSGDIFALGWVRTAKDCWRLVVMFPPDQPDADFILKTERNKTKTRDSLKNVTFKELEIADGRLEITFKPDSRIFEATTQTNIAPWMTVADFREILTEADYQEILDEFASPPNEPTEPPETAKPVNGTGAPQSGFSTLRDNSVGSSNEKIAGDGVRNDDPDEFESGRERSRVEQAARGADNRSDTGSSLDAPPGIRFDKSLTNSHPISSPALRERSGPGANESSTTMAARRDPEDEDVIRQLQVVIESVDSVTHKRRREEDWQLCEALECFKKMLHELLREGCSEIFPSPDLATEERARLLMAFIARYRARHNGSALRGRGDLDKSESDLMHPMHLLWSAVLLRTSVRCEVKVVLRSAAGLDVKLVGTPGKMEHGFADEGSLLKIEATADEEVYRSLLHVKLAWNEGKLIFECHQLMLKGNQLPARGSLHESELHLNSAFEAIILIVSRDAMNDTYKTSIIPPPDVALYEEVTAEIICHMKKHSDAIGCACVCVSRSPTAEECTMATDQGESAAHSHTSELHDLETSMSYMWKQ